MVEVLGSKEALLLEINWSEEVGATAAEATRGSLRLWAHGQELWPGGGYEPGLEWTWIELAEFLARFWNWLIWENGFPFELQGESIGHVRADLDRRWSLLSMAVRDMEEEDFYSFEERHDLARAISGAVAPSVWLVREGNMCWISTHDSSVLVPFGVVEDVLRGFVEAILARLRNVEDERADALRAAWATRSQVLSEDVVSIATGLERSVLLQLEGGQDPASFWEFEADHFEITELVAAARLASALPTGDASSMLATIRSTSRYETPELDELSALALEALPVGPEWYPYDQGYFVADWLRGQIGIRPEDPVDPEDLLKKWGVQIQKIRLSTAEVDAIASWGPRHGPSVIVNNSGAHNSSREGMRATYAHEIAHILLDRTTALPLAEVIGGRAVGNTEERARAFAAQLLLPKEVAGRKLSASTNPVRTVRDLRKRYQVSHEIVAWQARNSDSELPVEVRSVLRRFVSRPWRF